MIEQFISCYKQQFNDYLTTFIKQSNFPCKRMEKAVSYTTLAGGKRFRPILVYLCGEYLSAPTEVLNIIATTIELIHCYSLIHDDLPAMDNDDLRRGKPTCHLAFDEATAILAGDGLQTLAFEHLFLLEQYLDPKQVIKIAKAIVNAIGFCGMVSGQSLDLICLADPKVDISTLEQIHQLKTGKLISICIQSVIYADNKKQYQYSYQNLLDFADYLGTAFQMQDDYLDKYANTIKLGKQQGSDANNLKTTYSSLFDEQTLAKLIADTYNNAKESLVNLGDADHKLIAFTNFLAKRTY